MTTRIPVLIAVLFAAATAGAQGIILPEPVPRPRPDRRPVPPPVRTAPLVPSRVRIAAEVQERAARVHLDQTFTNTTGRTLEGTFMLALPRGAVVSELAFHVDGERVKGELLDAGRAREVYESIVRRARDPALLEWAGRDLVRLSIFPIAAGADARVEVIYAQVLERDGRLVELGLPLRTPGDHRERAADVAVRVALESERPLGPVYSPSHEIVVERPSKRRAEVRFTDRRHRLDRDLTLVFAPADQGVGIEALSFRPDDDDGFFLLLITPESGGVERAAKDVVFVLDTSGSMRQQSKLDKAVRALTFGLEGLGRDDRFALLSFATEARAWRSDLVRASRDNVAAAVAHLRGLNATGGTALDEALVAGLGLFDDGDAGDRPRYLVFLTDGMPTVGVTDATKIAQRLAAGDDTSGASSGGAAASRPRVFTFGVGYDVNAVLLDQLAVDGHGRSQYVKPEEDLEVKVSSFFEKMNQPVLTGLKLRVGGVEVRDLHPRTPPDLFAGEDLVVAGRYRRGGDAVIALEGRLRGRKLKMERPVALARRADAMPHLAVIWAERRIGYLLEQIRLHGENSELRDEVVRLAKAYGLVTPYTSYLVAEEEPRLALAPRRMERFRVGTARRVRDDADGVVGGAPAEAPAAAPAPSRARPAAKASGEAQVAASEEIQRFKEARAGRESGAVKVVRGKRFSERDGVWIDAGYRAGMKEERVVAFSDAYFELLKKHPELGEYLALGERVVIVLGDIAYRVEPA